MLLKQQKKGTSITISGKISIRIEKEIKCEGLRGWILNGGCCVLYRENFIPRSPEFNYTQFGDVIFMYLFKCDGNPERGQKGNR